jgi:SAM-dependent methyltransferase
MSEQQQAQGGHQTVGPSPWLTRWAGLIPGGAQVLDLACGKGRHSRYLAALGYRVCAVDRDPKALEAFSGVAGIEAQLADLENAPWPFGSGRFGGIVVTNYLHRPLFTHILDALTDDGVLIYETFALGNERFGRPSRPEFLLRPGELLEVVRHRLRVVAFEDGEVDRPVPAMVQRLCACAPRAVALQLRD